MAHIEIEHEFYDISVREFLDSCTKTEKTQIKRILNDENNMSISEVIFEEHLDAIHGNWNRLSSEEEEQIMKIGGKFK